MIQTNPHMNLINDYNTINQEQFANQVPMVEGNYGIQKQASGSICGNNQLINQQSINKQSFGIISGQFGGNIQVSKGNDSIQANNWEKDKGLQ